MEAAFGALYMNPATFWALTWPEYRAAMQGWRRYGPPAWLGGSEEPKKKKKTEIQRTLEFMQEVRDKDGPEKDQRVIDFLKEARRRGRT
jgi:hypothetical protein